MMLAWPCAVWAVDNATIEIDGPEVPIMDGAQLPLSPRSNQAGGILTQTAVAAVSSRC